MADLGYGPDFLSITCATELFQYARGSRPSSENETFTGLRFLVQALLAATDQDAR